MAPPFETPTSSTQRGFVSNPPRSNSSTYEESMQQQQSYSSTIARLPMSSLVSPEAASIGMDESEGWISEPSPNDVLCGRGGSINCHVGNERFRTLVDRRRRVYLTARFKREKRLIASSIVSEIRALKPPGRFLMKDTKTGQWRDIGDEKARDKTAQALRENAPTIRAEIEGEMKEQRTAGLGTDSAVAWGDEDDDDEGIHRVESSSSGKQQPLIVPVPTPPPPPPSYYHPWGYSYYGYAPPPPTEHPLPAYAYPPPPTSYSNPAAWPYPAPSYGYPPPPHHHQHQPSSNPVSALEQTAETIKSYFGLGGVASVDPSAGQGGATHHSRSRSISSKKSQPIHYVHNDRKRRIVQFREDVAHHRRNNSSSTPTKNNPDFNLSRPANHTSHGNIIGGGNSTQNSLMDDLGPEEDDQDEIEPTLFSSHQADDSGSYMLQVANHILNSIGSWDGNTICGGDTGSVHDGSERYLHSRSRSGQRNTHHQMQQHRDEASFEAIPDEEMTVEWEGQEVLLMDNNNNTSSTEKVEREASPVRMPPPRSRPFHYADRQTNEHSSLGGLSSIGSCQSWLPEQFSGAASFFNSNSSWRNQSSAAPSVNCDDDMGSMDISMEYSNPSLLFGGGGQHDVADHSSAAGGSLGNSLSRIFEHEHFPEDDTANGPHSLSPMSQRTLNQVPSWERSLRSRSPLSLGSCSMPDDASLISSKSPSNKLNESSMHYLEKDSLEHRVWETRE